MFGPILNSPKRLTPSIRRTDQRCGYALATNSSTSALTPMMLTLSIHPSRRVDLVTDQVLEFSPTVRARDYVDGFGNICTRILVPSGATRISTLFEIEDSRRGRPACPPA